MSSTQHPSIDYQALLDDVVDSPALPTRLHHHTTNGLTDLATRYDTALTDTTITTITDETETILTDYMNSAQQSKDQYLNDVHNLTTFGGALLTVLRRHDIPITATEVTDVINANTDFTRLRERFTGDLTADYTDTPRDNIQLRTDTRTYQFRLETDTGNAPKKTTLKRVLNGMQSTHETNIANLREYISNSTIEEKQLMRRKRELDSFNSELNPPPSRNTFIQRYADELTVHTNTETRALTIADVFPETTGRSRPVASAAALWLAVQQTGERVIQEDIIEATSVSGPAIRNATSDIEQEVEAIFEDTIVAIEPGGVTAVPDGIVDALGITDQYVEYPTGLPGSTIGDRLELRVTGTVPESGKVLTPTNTTTPGTDRWCPIDEIPLPDVTDTTNSLPDKIQWDYSTTTQDTTLYVTLPSTNTTDDNTDTQTALDAF